jgi:hypothetical protein
MDLITQLRARRRAFRGPKHRRRKEANKAGARGQEFRASEVEKQNFRKPRSAGPIAILQLLAPGSCFLVFRPRNLNSLLEP